MLGLLSNPIVTILYVLEQAQIFLFGSTSKARDIYIIRDTVLDVGVVLVASMMIEEAKIIYMLLAYAAFASQLDYQSIIDRVTYGVSNACARLTAGGRSINEELLAL